jgi:hypothetical protein
MNWSVSFEPLIPWVWIAAGFVPLLILACVGLFLRRRGAWLRLLAFLALALALANPVLLDELRDPLKSVVALVVDKSQSQDIGDRARMTDAAVEELKAKLARFKQFDVRVVDAGRSPKADERAETKLFAALDSTFRDVPPSRIGGAIMVTDGEVHDIPSKAGSFPAPLHVLITGRADERDRRIFFQKAPRFGIVGKPLELTYKITDTAGGDGTVNVRVSVNGET